MWNNEYDIHTQPIPENTILDEILSVDELDGIWRVIKTFSDKHEPEVQQRMRAALFEEVPKVADFAAGIEKRLLQAPHVCLIRGVDWLHSDVSKRNELVVALMSLFSIVSDSNAYNDRSKILFEEICPINPESDDVTYRYDCEVHADESSKPKPEDLVSLWSVHPAEDGGNSLIWTVADIKATLASQPDGERLLKFLYQQSFPFGGKFRQPPRVLMAPILYGENGIRFRRGAINDGFESLGQSPSQRELEALEALVEAIACTPAYEYRLSKSEALVLLNRHTLHSRTHFTDPKRCLIKVRAYSEALTNSADDASVGWWDEHCNLGLH